MERRIERLIEEGRKPACVIMEAAMMNLGIVLPEPGYLEAVRELTTRHGIVLIFDEVKTGMCIAAGGATERFGVTPDMVTLAKALGGGLPDRRDRRHRGAVRDRRERHGRPGRHLQRQPARHGRRARQPRGSADAGGLRAPRRAQRAHPGRLSARRREVRLPGVRDRDRLEGLRDVLPGEDRRLRDRSRRTRTPISPISRGTTT